MRLNLMTSCSGTGYGVAGTNILKALQAKGHEVALFPNGGYPQEDFIRKGLDKAKNFGYNDPCVNIWHQHSLHSRVGRGKYFAMPIFELDQFNEQEAHNLRFPDHILVCSKWAQTIISENLSIESSVVPLGVDQRVFYPRSSPVIVKDNPDQYVFLNIGKIEKRKGHDFLGKIFSKAFEPTDNVKLVVSWYNPFLTPEEVQQWENSYMSLKLASKIKLVSKRWANHEDIAALINACDCGVYPARAEGWNLELLESLACGKPVITTNYSAHTEFCTSKNSLLIDITNREPAFDGKWFFRQGNWAEFDYEQEEQMIHWMRKCYKDRVKENPGGLETASEFTWDNTANKLLEAINA